MWFDYFLAVFDMIYDIYFVIVQIIGHFYKNNAQKYSRPLNDDFFWEKSSY